MPRQKQEKQHPLHTGPLAPPHSKLSPAPGPAKDLLHRKAVARSSLHQGGHTQHSTVHWTKEGGCLGKRCWSRTSRGRSSSSSRSGPAPSPQAPRAKPPTDFTILITSTGGGFRFLEPRPDAGHLPAAGGIQVYSALQGAHSTEQRPGLLSTFWKPRSKSRDGDRVRSTLLSVQTPPLEVVGGGGARGDSQAPPPSPPRPPEIRSPAARAGWGEQEAWQGLTVDTESS